MTDVTTPALARGEANAAIIRRATIAHNDLHKFVTLTAMTTKWRRHWGWGSVRITALMQHGACVRKGDSTDPDRRFKATPTTDHHEIQRSNAEIAGSRNLTLSLSFYYFSQAVLRYTARFLWILISIISSTKSDLEFFPWNAWNRALWRKKHFFKCFPKLHFEKLPNVSTELIAEGQTENTALPFVIDKTKMNEY